MGWAGTSASSWQDAFEAAALLDERFEHPARDQQSAFSYQLPES